MESYDYPKWDHPGRLRAIVRRRLGDKKKVFRRSEEYEFPPELSPEQISELAAEG